MNEICHELPTPGGIVGSLQTPAQIDVVEIDPTKVARAQELLCGKATVRLGDIRFLPYADEKFDLIVDASTLDHVPQEQLGQVLDEYERVLTPIGRAAIMTWATDNDVPHITNHEHSWTPYYTCYFTYPELEQAIGERFDVEERQRFYEDDNGFMVYFLARKKEE